jgi:hypothetical protein
MTNCELGNSNLGAESDISATKLAYQRPSLTVYGSVRDLSGGASGGFADGVANKSMATSGKSDPAVKENAVRIGTHPAGFGIYLFDYKAGYKDAHGHGRQFGVMANEVEIVAPEAVVIEADGYRAVNYTMLGITRH